MIDGLAVKVLAPERDDRRKRLLAAAREYARADHPHRREAAVAYLFELADIMAEVVGSDAAIEPLLDIIPFVANPMESHLIGERRSPFSPPSEAVLARAAVAIDVHVLLGASADDAAQHVARQMINARVRLPEEGYDVRGWKRLLQWRDRLVETHEPAGAFEVFAAMQREIDRLPKHKIRELASDSRLWDARVWRRNG